MSRFSKYIYSLGNSHDLIYKSLLFISVIAAIVYILPKEGKFKYEINKGKRWMDKDLYAPFDFGIYKSGDELTAEINDLTLNSKPYLKIDTGVFYLRYNKFCKEFEQSWGEKNSKNRKLQQKDNLPPEDNITEHRKAYKELGKIMLSNIYAVGVLSPDLGFDKNKNDVILITNNLANEEKLSEFYTLQSAMELVKFGFSEFKDTVHGIENLDTLFLSNLLSKQIISNVFYDEAMTKKVLQSQIDEIAPTHGKIKKGELIIAEGSMVNLEKLMILESLKKEYEIQSGFSYNFFHVLLGQIILAFSVVGSLLIFLITFRKDIFTNNNKIVFLLLLIFSFVFIAKIAIKSNAVDIYILPFCILPILVRVFFDTRLSLFVHMITMLLIGYMAPNKSFEFVFIQYIAGFIAIVSVINMRNRGQLFYSAAVIFLTYAIIYTGLAIIQEGNFENLKLINYIWFASSAALTLFAYPMMYAFEKLFGFVSDVTLLELSDTNSPLLRELAEKAPGTFQHCIQVANLAEDAIYQIGGNPLLVRTGALYHDIGKVDLPVYFIENQPEGINPHHELSNEDSVKIIISHITRGIKKAHEHKLPEQIIDFIRTHHGMNVVMYFFHNFLREHPDEPIDKSQFTYPGPIPFSKETAVLMMADCVEAASRTLKERNPELIDEMVENVINHQVNNGQFANSDITFKDVHQIKKKFKKKLMNIHHLRVDVAH